MTFSGIKGYYVIQKGSPIRAIYREKPQDFDAAHRSLAHRIDQLAFDVTQWRAERQKQSDIEGIKEQIRLFGAANVYGKPTKSRRDGGQEAA